MSLGIYQVPKAKNEPVRQYAKNSVERAQLLEEIIKLKSQSIEVPMVIGGKEIFTNDKIRLSPP